MRFALSLALLAALTGCNESNHNVALLNDVAVRVEEDSGYRVISVNGKKEKRLSSSFVTVVPFVVVDPGVHVIGVRKTETSNPQSSFSANFEAGKRYRIKEERGTFLLIEENEK